MSSARTLNRRELRRLVVLERNPSDTLSHERPRTRGDCEDGPRPCPYVGCRHHLYLEVMPSGSLKLNYPHLEPEDLQHSCSLDPDVQGISLTEVQRITGLTRQGVEYIENQALRKLAQLARGEQ